jgi:hypothetical protein
VLDPLVHRSDVRRDLSADFSSREFDHESRATIFPITEGGYRSTMKLDEMPCNGKAQAKPWRFASA